MLYVGYCFNLLQMSWYKIMKPFQTNLKLVIKTYFCVMHDAFTDVDYYSNDFMLGEMSQ